MTDTVKEPEAKNEETKKQVLLCPACEVELESGLQSCSNCKLPVKLARRQGKPVYLIDDERIDPFGFTLVDDSNGVRTYRKVTETEEGRKRYALIDYIVFHVSGQYYISTGAIKFFCPLCSAYLAEASGGQGQYTPRTCRNTLREEAHGRSGKCGTRSTFIIGHNSLASL